MAIQTLSVEGYRSIRRLDLRIDGARVVVVAGPNASGKTNLYRALQLLAAASAGRLARTLAEEGGMPSALWAGARRKEAVRMKVAVGLDDFGYELACGLPAARGHGSFILDPVVKTERASVIDGGRSFRLLDRDNVTTWLRDADGQRVTYPLALRDAESVLAQLQDPHRYPVVASLRQEFSSWRFYHQFRTDAASPLRQPQIGVQTPVLSADGADLGAALQTIRDIGDGAALDEAIARAFPGSTLHIDAPKARFLVMMEMPGIRRPLGADELSDGTLRYLCLLAALLSPRPPSLLALNEPETSLHPDLLEPLAHLVADAGQRGQIWITTHAEPLAAAIGRLAGIEPLHLTKVQGETRIAGRRASDGDDDEDDDDDGDEDEER
jgi:predicted ATPase